MSDTVGLTFTSTMEVSPEFAQFVRELQAKVDEIKDEPWLSVNPIPEMQTRVNKLNTFLPDANEKLKSRENALELAAIAYHSINIFAK